MDRKDRSFVLAACLGSAVLGAAGSQFLSIRDAHAQASTLRTSRLEITDNAGKVRGLLAMTKDGQPIYAFYGQNGKARMIMTLGDADVPVFTMNGTAGHDIIGMSVNADDSAAINFSDKADKVRGSMVIEKDGRFAIELSDVNGKTTKKWP